MMGSRSALVGLVILLASGCIPPGFSQWKAGASTNASSQPTEAFPRSFAGKQLADAPAAPGGAVATAPAKRAAATPRDALRRGAPQPNAFALVVGVEKYRDVPPPPGARADAERFVELAKTSLGVPPKQILVALDDRAGKADIEKHLAWLEGNVPNGARVFFFFAGHGAPDVASGSAFLLPADADAKFITTTGLPMETVLASLQRTKASQVVVFVDACFSGSGPRSVLAPGIRPLVRVVEPTAPGRVALFASAQANETSGPAPGLAVGLFTHTLVQALGTGQADVDGDGNVSLDELRLWVPPRVTREAARDNRAQHPTLSLGSEIVDPSKVWLAAALESK